MAPLPLWQVLKFHLTIMSEIACETCGEYEMLPSMALMDRGKPKMLYCAAPLCIYLAHVTCLKPCFLTH